jgi:hypothetical protein
MYLNFVNLLVACLYGRSKITDAIDTFINDITNLLSGVPHTNEIKKVNEDRISCGAAPRILNYAEIKHCSWSDTTRWFSRHYSGKQLTPKSIHYENNLRGTVQDAIATV